ncbi:MAG: phosphoribosylaminoimidazolesuccinocarboxamide synthase [Bacteroidota bacterium]|nr:phosphoribosylaminoimidazolesuccinocarboxamide synthase [Rhodothermia bacterium]MCS7155618.1 phosphoribosylaminoimidazolesuccinocarboxamide synthase [Bacteroidota bacterium]MDW8137242.1 phosphoribosylaminoimidazolesuccinocarboxamide synthase [Bacteroidota bacterium]MDW8284888.1 phosphoribosylaminoimidazolesuccinocarboxamide synthase [Bacteroidota bacterium]
MIDWERALRTTVLQTHFPWGERRQGKVRDTYALDDWLILVTTDRVSAFDYVFPEPIPLKGQVLTGLTAYFLEASRHIAPNHLVAMPDPNVLIARRTRPYPVEIIVRGYLAGHAWRIYASGIRELCGVRLPEGLHAYEALPEPIVTPTTKAITGHDQDMSPRQLIERGLVPAHVYEQMEAIALALYRHGAALAAARGLILADTKYEFGDWHGRLLLIDELHTPDSSRYFFIEDYETALRRGRPPRQLSKEFLREYLLEQGFRGDPDQAPPPLPESLRLELARRYVELYELLTAQRFMPAYDEAPLDRIYRRVCDWLRNQGLA